MMTRRFFIVLIAFVVGIGLISPTECYAKRSKKADIEEKKILQPVKFASEAELYKYAQEDLDKNAYRVYRTTERLIRANKLDNYPWIIEMPQTTDQPMLVSTAEGNIIVLNYGIVSTFCDDVSALAFIIAHEMAHATQKHVSKSKAYNADLIQQLDEETKAFKDNKDNYVKNETVLKQVFQAGLPYNTNSVTLQKQKEKIEELQKRIQEDNLALSRKHEYESDRIGLEYMIKAGFSPVSSTKFFEFEKRAADTSIEDYATTHPTADNRIWQIEKELKSINKNKLVMEGRNNIKSSKPLTYQKKSEYKYSYPVKRTLIINSKYGTNQEANDPFKNLFGY